MNKVFRVVWNETLGSWVVVSENAKSKVKTQRKRLKQAISNIILLSLTVVPASFVLADGIYINSAYGITCNKISASLSEYTDGATSQTRFCQPRDVSIQVNRILFYGAIGGDPTANAINLMVGGTAYINSGSLGLGGGQQDTDAQGSIRIGGGVESNTSLDNYGQRREPSGTLGGSSGMYAIAIGGGEAENNATIASGNYATAVGYNSRALGLSSLALGNTAIASGENSLALGTANATLMNSVALGEGATTTASTGSGYLTKQAAMVFTKEIVGENNETTTREFVGHNVVSVGSESLKRRIQNLADGAEDSDAVTVAQLKQVGKVAASNGFGLTAADGKSIEKDLGETITVIGADSNITTQVNTSNNELEIELSKDLTGLNSVEVVDASDPTKKTTTTASGTVVTDGKNTSTLAATGTTVTDGTNTSVYGADGVNINEGSVILNDAGLNVGGVTVSNTGINANGTQISGVGDATSKDQAVNLGQLQELSTAGTTGGFGLTTEDGEVKQDLGKSIAVVGADSNISTKVNNGQVEIELNKELTGLTSIETVDASDPTKKTTTTASGTVVTDGKNTSTLAATGTTVTDGTNTSVYGADGVNINEGSVILNDAGLNVGGIKVSKNGIDANNTTISNVANATSKDQAVNLGQLQELSTAGTTGGFGLKAQDGVEVKQDLGKSIAVVGADSNISTKVNNGQVEIELNKELTGLNSVEVVDATDPTKKTTTTAGGTVVTDGKNTSTLAATGTTVTDGTNSSIYGVNGVNIHNGTVVLDNTGLDVSGVTVRNTGINANGTQISGVGDATSKDQAVNLGQLQELSTAGTTGGFGLTTEDGEVKQDLGKSIAVVGADSNISTKVNNGQVEIELNKELTGLNSVEVVDASDPTKKTTTTASGTVVTDGTNTSVYGANGVNINEGSVILNDAGLNVGGVTVRNTGINANGTQISGVGDATSKDQAVNLGQLQELSAAGTTGGFGLKAQDGVEVKQDLGKSIAVVGADSNISTKVNNGQVEIELNKELTGLTSIETVDALDPAKKTTTTASGTVVTDGKNTSTLAATGTTVTDGTNTSVYGANGVNINEGSVILNDAGLNVGGVTVSNTGINANGTQISGLGNATSKDQAVNLGQLQELSAAGTTGGFGLKAQDGVEVKQDLGKSIAVVGVDSNISTKVNNGQVEIELNKELTGLTSIETVDASDPAKKTTTTASGTVVTDGKNTSTLAATGTTVTDGTNSSIYGVNGVNIHNGTVVLDHTGLNVGGVTVSKNGINANGTQISNVANATSNDQAVNLGQLNDRLENLTTGGIQYDDEATKDKVTLGGHGGTTITNVKDGEIAKGSSDAVNGGQIYDLENNLQNQITNNSNDIFDLQNQINNIDAGNNLVQQETPTSEVTIAGKTGGNSVNVAGTDGDRKVTGVANGQISANSVDAVNGSQLQTNYDNVAAGLGGGAKYENGTWTGPEYTVGETTVTNVGDAIDALNKSDQQLDSQLTSLSNKVDNMYITTNERIDRLEKDTNSGIASAIAIASLPQPTEKGYTMMSAGTGVWKGEAGLAIGASGVTEDRMLFKKPVNYIWKFASTVDTRSNWGGGASVGVQWK